MYDILLLLVFYIETGVISLRYKLRIKKWLMIWTLRSSMAGCNLSICETSIMIKCKSVTKMCRNLRVWIVYIMEGTVTICAFSVYFISFMNLKSRDNSTAHTRSVKLNGHFLTCYYTCMSVCEEQCAVGHHTWPHMIPLDDTVFKEDECISNLIPNDCFLYSNLNNTAFTMAMWITQSLQMHACKLHTAMTLQFA